MLLKYPTNNAIPTKSIGLKNVITIKDLLRTLAMNSLFIISDMMLILDYLDFWII
jgi:hypothetical protein